MNFHLIPIPVSLGLIAAYLVARKRNDLQRTAVIQPLTTPVSLIVAALNLIDPDTNHAYTIWILVGMALCLLVDVFNLAVPKAVE